MTLYTFTFRLHGYAPDCKVRCRAENQSNAFADVCLYLARVWSHRWNHDAGVFLWDCEPITNPGE